MLKTTAEWGESAENLVQERYERFGYRLIRKRWRTPFAEIDLFMGNLQECVVIEVKRISRRGFVETRISKDQRRRLQRAQIFLQDRMRVDVRLVLALVDEDDKIVLFNLGEADLE